MMRADHPDAGKPLSERFCALEHVLVSYEGESFHGVTDDALAKAGRERRVGLSVSSFLVLPDVLAISDMIAVVPERMAENRVDMFVCDTPVPVPDLPKAWPGMDARTETRRRCG
jgi:DNA-binding transcriptional LysR family regulator